MSEPWSYTEVNLIIADYFNMLSAELNGKTYSKAEHRRALIPLLKKRSESSIEFKHQNISAVLIDLGQLYIKGYVPRFNYQQLLKDAVIEYLNQKRYFEDQFRSFSDRTNITRKTDLNFAKFIVEPPKVNFVTEPKVSYVRKTVKTNYLEREQRNQVLGLLGEELVIEFEKWHLRFMGKENLAENVRWVSQEEGDGAGFDILSRNLNGTDKYIEVKTTKLAKETPIFFSKNELDFSVENSRNYHLYRVFDFEQQARMFTRNGALDQICQTVPLSFKGYF